MLGFIFKGKRKIPLYQLATEFSLNEKHKRKFLQRYIIMLLVGLIILLWVNGQNEANRQWSYYFALTKDNHFATEYSLDQPQPFTKEDIVQYATAIAYQVFSVTPATYQQKHNEFFDLNFAASVFVNQVTDAVNDSGLINRLKQGWYFAVTQLSEPDYKISMIQVSGKNVVLWKITFNNFIFILIR